MFLFIRNMAVRTSAAPGAGIASCFGHALCSYEDNGSWAFCILLREAHTNLCTRSYPLSSPQINFELLRRNCTPNAARMMLCL